MKVEVSKDYSLILKEVFNGICLETEGGGSDMCVHEG